MTAEVRRYVVFGGFDQSEQRHKSKLLLAYDAKDAIEQGSLAFRYFDVNSKRFLPGLVTNVEPWNEERHGPWIEPWNERRSGL